MSGFKTPVVLLNFNRPQMTRRVFEIVRQIKPERLLLVADGPRPDRPEDVRLCAEVRAVFDEIDWECEVSRRFSDTNLGSFRSNSSGLNWAFELVDEAIILEDDFLPSLSFFRYSEELLDRYRDDDRIGVISANNFAAPSPAQAGASYYFSAYALTWGWATWKRVWQKVDLTMSWWAPDVMKDMLRTLHPDAAEWQYWYRLYEKIHDGRRRNAWDYQLILSAFRHSQLCIMPRINMVTNIGYGPEAVHTTDENAPLANLPRSEMDFPLIHPVGVWRSGETDHAIFRTRIAGRPHSLFLRGYWKLVSLIPASIRTHLKRWFRKESR